MQLWIWDREWRKFYSFFEADDARRRMRAAIQNIIQGRRRMQSVRLAMQAQERGKQRKLSQSPASTFTVLGGGVKKRDCSRKAREETFQGKLNSTVFAVREPQLGPFKLMSSPQDFVPLSPHLWASLVYGVIF